ncbi:MAG: NAD-dependent epimerase/dehydratase family protein [Desulfosoma sp.]
MRKVVVTGATGFAGGMLCRRLVEGGAQIRAFVRSTSRKDTLEALGVECRVVDITNPEAVMDHCAGCTSVYHIAAAYRTELSDRAEFWRVNVDATRNLLEAAKRHNVKRFVHCSTAGVQGEITNPPANETYRYQPTDHYQTSKMEGELCALRYFADGLPGVVVRPVGIYGPGDTRFLKLFKPISKGWFVMIGSGDVLYHMTYIDDLIDGFLLAGTRDSALGQIFTLAGPQYTTVRELVDLIADVLHVPRPRWRVPLAPVYAMAWLCERACRPLGIAPPLYPRRLEFFRHHRAFNIQKARTLLGYEPKVGLREGLEKTAQWYREQGLIS